MKSLSLILPIYNVEKYLKKCLESIVIQKEFSKIEVLLIDDGSTDSCPKICDDYGNKYSNIKVFHKKNGGLSDARNYGLLKSKSDYVFFVDSDDELTSNSISSLIKKINENDVDIVLFNAECINENNDLIEIKYKYSHDCLKEKIYNGLEVINQELDQCQDFKTQVWLGIYKKDFLFREGLLFEKDLIHEDEMWSPKVFLKAYSILYLNKVIYRYRIRNNSIMRDSEKNYRKHLINQIYIFESLFVYYDNKIYDKKLLKKINNFTAGRYLHCLSVNKIVKNKDLIRKVSRLKILIKSNCFKNIVRSLLLLTNIFIFDKITNKQR